MRSLTDPEKDLYMLSPEILRLRLALLQIDELRNVEPAEIARKALATQPISERGKNWLLFADQVFHHVEDYTVKQYGDTGSDQVSEWTGDDCAKQVGKYLGRRGRNARPGQELPDMLKAAHYVQLTEEKDREATHQQLTIGSADLRIPLSEHDRELVENHPRRCDHCGAVYHNRYIHTCLEA